MWNSVARHKGGHILDKHMSISSCGWSRFQLPGPSGACQVSVTAVAGARHRPRALDFAAKHRQPQASQTSSFHQLTSLIRHRSASGPAARSHSCPSPAAASASNNPSASAAAGDAGGTSWPPPLEQWLRSHGGIVNGVQLRTLLFPSGSADRQLVATADHPPGALIISVPRHLQLRYDNIEEAAAGATDAAPAPNPAPAPGPDPLAIPPHEAAAVTALYDKMPRGSDTGGAAWQFKQALTLLYHLSRGSASPLLPYLAHLPGLAPGVPTPRVAMLMYDDAVDELQYGTLVQDVRNQKYWLRHVGREVLGGLTTGDSDGGGGGGSGGGSGGGGGGGAASPFCGLQVDEELFGWAAAVAMSRCFGLSRFRTHTCVPLVDMANHVAPYDASNCEIRSGPDGEVNMFTKRRVETGEELTLTYGSHDNHNLLLSYGFTMQPNPNDAFYFDLDLDSLQDLVAGVGPEGGLAPWQLELLRSKLGLGAGTAATTTNTNTTTTTSAAAVAERSDEGGAAGGPAAAAAPGEDGAAAPSRTLKLYLAAGAPSAPGAGAAAAQAAGEVGEAGPGRGGAGGGAAGSSVVRQPVDPRLLAAVRIATLQDEAWSRELAPMSADQIGDWHTPLARQQEISLLRLLAALVAGIYTTFPTTLQQDRALLASASLDVAAAAAAVTLTTATALSTAAPTSQPGRWPLRPHTAAAPLAAPSSSSGSTSSNSTNSSSRVAGVDPDAAAVAAHARDMAEAVRFRLGLKTTLEGCLRALVARAKELDALQTVR